MSRDANGYNKYYRPKVLLNAAAARLRRTVLKLNEWRKAKVLLEWLAYLSR